MSSGLHSILKWSSGSDSLYLFCSILYFSVAHDISDMICECFEVRYGAKFTVTSKTPLELKPIATTPPYHAISRLLLAHALDDANFSAMEVSPTFW
jgi:hypothetical protein